MRKIKEILRLRHENGLSLRKIYHLFFRKEHGVNRVPYLLFMTTWSI